jgi:hypothetical protein
MACTAHQHIQYGSVHAAQVNFAVVYHHDWIVLNEYKISDYGVTFNWHVGLGMTFDRSPRDLTKLIEGRQTIRGRKPGMA